MGIVAPGASGSGSDCTAAMHRTKLNRYANYTHELEQENIKYEPMVWSAYGRPHPNAKLILQKLAKKAARRRGMINFKPLYRRTAAKITVEIWRRAARMVMACLPNAEESKRRRKSQR